MLPRLLDELEALERGIAEQRGEVTGRLRVNVPQSFALSTLSPLLPRFLQQHPQPSLDLVMEDRLLDAVGEGFDVSLRLRAELDDSRLVARRLASLQQVLCAAPSYLQQHPAPQAVGDLQAHSVLAYSPSDSLRQLAAARPGWAGDDHPAGTRDRQQQPAIA